MAKRLVSPHYRTLRSFSGEGGTVWHPPTQGLLPALVRATAPSAAESRTTELLSAVQVPPGDAQLPAVSNCVCPSLRRSSSWAFPCEHQKSPPCALHHRPCAAWSWCLDPGLLPRACCVVTFLHNSSGRGNGDPGHGESAEAQLAPGSPPAPSWWHAVC